MTEQLRIIFGGSDMIKINLSRILGERRISQKKLAEMAHLRPSTVNMVYNEKAQRIDFDVLNRFCKALNCQPGDLLEYLPDTEEDANKNVTWVEWTRLMQ